MMNGTARYRIRRVNVEMKRHTGRTAEDTEQHRVANVHRKCEFRG